MPKGKGYGGSKGTSGKAGGHSTHEPSKKVTKTGAVGASARGGSKHMDSYKSARRNKSGAK